MAEQNYDLIMVFGSSAADAYQEEGVKGLKKAINNGDGEIVRREFKTAGEREAYLQGLEDMNGWEDYASVEPADVAKNEKYFKKF